MLLAGTGRRGTYLERVAVHDQDRGRRLPEGHPELEREAQPGVFHGPRRVCRVVVEGERGHALGEEPLVAERRADGLEVVEAEDAEGPVDALLLHELVVLVDHLNALEETFVILALDRPQQCARPAQLQPHALEEARDHACPGPVHPQHHHAVHGPWGVVRCDCRCCFGRVGGIQLLPAQRGRGG